MQNKLIAAAILAGSYYFIKNSKVRAGILGVAGVMVSNYVPYVNGKDLKQTTDAMKASA